MTYEEEIEKQPFAPEVEAALREAAVGRAPGKLAKLACAQSEDEAFIHLPGAAAAAFHLGQFPDAKLYAERASSLAPDCRGNWNYGNALHLGHMVLGLLALSEGDVSRAVDELHASACILDEDEVHHQPDNFSWSEVLPGGLIGDFRELPNQLLKDETHLRVVHGGRVQVDVGELLSH